MHRDAGEILPNGHSTADAARYHAIGAWAGHTLGSALRRQARARSDKLAVASVDASLTYGKLDELSDRFGAALLGRGLEPGDAALFQLGNEVETAVALFGVLKAGLTPVCSIPNHGLYEVRHIAEATTAKAHLFQADYRQYDLRSLSRDLGAQAGVGVRIVARGTDQYGAESMEHLIDDADPEESRAVIDAVQADLDPDRCAVYQLSGGTTGAPKVIGHPHSSYGALARNWAANLGWGPDTVACTFLPVMHNAGLATALLPALLSGGAAVLCRSPDPAQLAELVARYRVTWLHFSLAAYQPLVEHAAAHHYDFSSISHFTWTYIRPTMSANAEALLCAPAVGSFGMGEGILLSARRDDDALVRRTTVGTVISPLDSVRVFRPGTDDEVPDGVLGELVFSGPTIIRSYVAAEPEVNQTHFTSDGALRSGDLGRVVRAGDRRCVTMEGRIKDQIVRGGEKFMAEELEQLLLGHERVKEAAVVGVPHAGLGERVGVFVVSHPGVQPPDKGELVRYLQARGVAKFKWPEVVIELPELPRSGIGKVQKDRLRACLPPSVDEP